MTCRCGRRNGDTSFLLLFHPVHGSSTFVRITDLVVHACVIQDTFCKSSLTCIDMSHNTNISGSI